MKTTSTPVCLWDYCWVYSADIRSLVATDNMYLDGNTPFSKVHGYTPDISEYLTFKWYDWVWYHEPNDPDKSLIGRWLGPAHDIGQGLAYYVLNDKGKVVIRSTVSPLSDNESNSPAIKEQMLFFSKSKATCHRGFVFAKNSSCACSWTLLGRACKTNQKLRGRKHQKPLLV